MTEAAHLLLQKLNQGQAMADKPAVSEEATKPAHKPIWEVSAEFRRVPEEEWEARLTEPNSMTITSTARQSVPMS